MNFAVDPQQIWSEYLQAAMQADPTFTAARDQLLALTANGADVRSASHNEPAGR